MRRHGPRRSSARLLAGLLLVPWLAPTALALDPAKAVTQYVHDVWQAEQGLPASGVRALCQTRDGYLWLGTEEGLVRFDGVRFTVFDKRNTPELTNNAVYALREDREGALWIGTGGGLARLRDGAFTSFAAKGGPPHEAVYALHEDRKGNLWVGTNVGGLKRLRNGAFSSFTTKEGLAHDQVNALAEDRDGNLWAGTFGGGLSRLSGGKLSSLGTVDGLSSDVVFAIHEDRQGTLWIGTDGGGLNRLRDGKLTSLTTKDGLSSDQVYAIAEDREGSLWIGTRGGGLNRYQNGVFTSFTTKQGLSSDQVYAIAEDREGSLWIGTIGGGLNRLRDGKVTSFTSREGLSNDQALPITEDRDGALYIGTFGGGLNRWKDGTFTSYTTKDGLSRDTISALHADRAGNLWIGTFGGGLNRLTSGAFTTFTTKQGLPSDEIRAIFEDRDGTLWIGTLGGGLARYRNGVFTSFTTKDGLSNDRVLAIWQDRTGTLWIGTGGGGLDRFDGAGAFTHFTTKEGLSSDQVYSIHEDREGTLWIGTYGGGLNRLRNGRFTSFTTKEGLFDDVVYQILEDAQDDLWMSCNKGIYRVSRGELDAFAEGKLPRITCISYGTADGMKSAECNGGQPAGWKTRDGLLWFPTARGIVRIDPARLPTNTLAPPVVLEEVLVDGKVLGRAPAEGIVLPPGTEKLELHYTALSFRAPQKVRFRYRLEGFDKDWVDAGLARTAHYTHLPPRAYTFRVLACNDDGVWNEVGARLGFRLEPHFHQTPWFYLLCALAVAGAAAAAQQARVRHLKIRERELVRLVAEKTDDLRGANEALLGANEELRSVNAKLGDAEERISRLLASGPAASESVNSWSKALAAEIAAAIGARAIGIWEVERDTVTAVSDSGLSPPSRDKLASLAATRQLLVDTGEGTILPVTGPSGELCGALIVSGDDIAWGDTERRLLEGFAHQLGGALEMSRMRRQLALAEERRAASRRELHEQGIATLQICPSCGRCYDHTTATCVEDGAPLESPRPLPYLLLGRYRLLQVLGQGGMGIVFSAHDQKLGRDVAVKLVRPEHFTNAGLLERFEREAHAVARIQHPGVIELFDSGDLDDGTAFIVMERLEGCDLRLLLTTYGRGKPAQVARLVRQGCAALRAAHRAGVVHRDVKPENVFLVDDPSGFRVKLLDFGLAKSMSFEKGLTQTGMILGTPAYMAPEQVQGEDVDSRADVYSFAAVAYEALTGKQAAAGNEPGRVLVHVLNTVPPLVSTVLPAIPPEVDAAFESALAKDPARRLKDIELWASSFVDVLETVPADLATVGWPVSKNFFTQLRDSRLDREPTVKLPGPRRS